ncbi:MAG: hypothetical protein P4L85_00995 [Paludisphaera borealis]|uniref:hypothetical protein n=1 Tax=Paludisphaera borealis TaxID=1387353 RepID=UPI00284E2526|nr:hypothetical protein [Paludisphaera borealis]MDR3617897.1 hypothetical protein [Paludisphaera borealis]
MIRSVRILVAGLVVALSFSSGCAGPKPAEPAAEEKLALDAVPAGVMEAARKQQPGVEFQWATKGWQDGVLIYKVQGESGEGMIHEVQVTAAGEVVAPPTK